MALFVNQTNTPSYSSLYLNFKLNFRKNKVIVYNSVIVENCQFSKNDKTRQLREY